MLTEREILERYDASLAAVNDQDGGRLAGTYAVEATATVVGSGVVATGAAAVLESFFRPLWRGISDARADRQLALVHERTIVVIAWLRGTHDGPFRGREASGRRVSLLVCRVLELDESGLIRRDFHYQDPATIIGQIGGHVRPHRPALASAGAPEVVFAAEHPREETHAALASKLEQAVLDRSADAFVALLANDAVLSVNFLSEDLVGRLQIAEQLRSWLPCFSKHRIDLGERMLVSRFVVSRLTMTGEWKGKPIVTEPLVILEFAGAQIARVMVFANGLALWDRISA